MKTHIIIAAAIALMPLTASAQEEPDVSKNEKSLFEQVANLQKKQDYFHLFMNMNGSFDANFNDGFQDGEFKMHELRLEAKGNVTDWLSYRYRQRINRNNNGNVNIDNLPSSIDWAGLGIQVDKRFSIFAGKQGAAYGGFETYINPIEGYEPTDLAKNLSCFLSGVNFIYDFTPTQQLQLQILDARATSSVTEQYGAGYEASKLPLMYSLNWNARWAKVFTTRYSASLASEAKSNMMKYFAFGNRMQTPKFDGYVDIKYSIEDADNKGIITSMLPTNKIGKVHDTEYLSAMALLKFRVLPDWNLVIQGMYETASLRKDFDGAEKGKYRTSLAYIGGVEYYPIKKSNLHFFLMYVGRSYKYTSRAEQYGNADFNTDRISIGYIYQLPMF
jgi:hypothetical protein